MTTNFVSVTSHQMVICVIPTVFTAYRDHPPPTRCMTGLPAVNSNHRLIISHGNSIISNEIIPASYPYFRICSQTLSTQCCCWCMLLHAEGTQPVQSTDSLSAVSMAVSLVCHLISPADTIPLCGTLSEWYHTRALEWCGYPTVKKVEDTFIRFDIIHECDRRTDRQTDGRCRLGSRVTWLTESCRTDTVASWTKSQLTANSSHHAIEKCPLAPCQTIEACTMLAGVEMDEGH